MILISFSTLALAFLTSMVFFNYLTAFRLEKAPPPKTCPKVSLLIPVRNEASQIPQLLKVLSEISYASLEIIFLDDESQDQTLLLLQSSTSDQIKVFSGKPLPPSWAGKPWACYQLAQLATGNIMIFCDADVRPGPDAITQTVGLMENLSVDVATALPFQEMKTFWEKAVIPFVMHLPILSLVPLRFSYRFKSPSWVVANGQWLAFSRKSYEAIQGHQSVKDSFLEDMELAKNAARKGFRVLPVIASKGIRVRMYLNRHELAEGFTKNLYLLCGKRASSLCVLAGFWAVVYLGPLWARQGMALLLLIGLRVFTLMAFRSSWATLLLHPVGALGFLVLMARSGYFWVFKKQVSWRGRAYPSDLV